MVSSTTTTYNQTWNFKTSCKERYNPEIMCTVLKKTKKMFQLRTDLHPCPQFASWPHGIIIVVKAIDPRLREGALKDYLTPVRDILRRNGNVVFSNNTGSPSSKNEHRRASALLRNIQNIKICMGKKPIVSVTFENERISIKNSLPYIKCASVTSLLWGLRADLWRFYGFLCKRFSFYIFI